MDFNPFEVFRPKEKPLHTKNRRFVLKEPLSSDGLFNGTEKTFLDEEQGLRTIEEVEVYQAGCQHYVGFQSPAELLAKCSFCEKTLCYRCGNLRCRRCLKIICESCAKVVDETVYCGKCRALNLIKNGFLSSIRSLHEFLSKDFS